MTDRALVDGGDTIPSVLDYDLEKDRYSLLVSGRCHDGQELSKSETSGYAAMDVALPRLTGFVFLRRLRGETGWPGFTVKAETTRGASVRDA